MTSENGKKRATRSGGPLDKLSPTQTVYATRKPRVVMQFPNTSLALNEARTRKRQGTYVTLALMLWLNLYTRVVPEEETKDWP